MSVPKIIYSFAIVYSTVPKKSKQLFFYEWVILTDAVKIYVETYRRKHDT